MKVFCKNKKFFYLGLLALIMALSMSCKNVSYPGDGDFSVPDATGLPATDLVDDITYNGNLTRLSYTVRGISDKEAEEEFPFIYSFYMRIKDNKIIDGFATLNDPQILKSGDEYSASWEESAIISGVDSKEHVKFTVASDKSSVTIIYTRAAIGDKTSFKIIYSGTLNKE